MSYEDWYHRQLYEVMFTEPEDGLDSSQYDLGPSDELIQHAFQNTVPFEVQCIDPSMLQLDPDQPDAEDMISLLDHAVECKQGSGDLASPDNLVSDISKVTESLMNIDNDFSGTAEASMVMETDEQFFDRPDVREVVNIHGISKIPGAPSSLEPEVEDQQGASSHAPLSSAPPLSSFAPPSFAPPSYARPQPSYVPLQPSYVPPQPSYAPPPPVALYTEPGVAVYLRGRVVQAWETHNGRQYLIRWEGFPPEFDSWWLAINISEQLTAEFERRLIRQRLN